MAAEDPGIEVCVGVQDRHPGLAEDRPSARVPLVTEPFGRNPQVGCGCLLPQIGSRVLRFTVPTTTATTGPTHCVSADCCSQRPSPDMSIALPADVRREDNPGDAQSQSGLMYLPLESALAPNLQKSGSRSGREWRRPG